MLKRKDIFVLDLGTSKFCLAAMRFPARSGDPSLETVSVAAAGMRRGMVANLVQAKESLLSLLETAERQMGCDITRVTVGIAGSHLTGRQVKTAVALHDERVSGSHLAQLDKAAKENFKAEGMEVLHAIPSSFRVDDRPPTADPTGLSGRHLSGSYFLFEADSTYLKDVLSLCNQCGLEVKSFAAEPYASSLVTTSQTDKSLGAVVCDIGGGTTDGVVYLAGRLASSFTVNIAGHMMTNDLAVCLNIPFEEAERVKASFGVLETPVLERAEFSDVNGRRIIIEAAHCRAILLPRLVELARHISQEIAPYRGSIGRGVIVTGGGAEVQGLIEIIESICRLPAVRIRPRIVSQGNAAENVFPDTVRIDHSGKLATAIGMIQDQLMTSDRARNGALPQKTPRYFRKILEWVRELS